MRILLANTGHPATIKGGAEAAVLDLARLLARRDHEVSLVVHHGGGEILETHEDGVAIFALPSRNLYFGFGDDTRRRPAPTRFLWHALDSANPFMAAAFGRVLDRVRPEVVNTHALAGLSPLVWRAAARRHIPLVHYLHEYGLLCPRGSTFRDGHACERACASCRVLSRPRRALSDLVDTVVGVSRYTLDRHLAWGAFRRAAARAVIPNVFGGLDPGSHISPRPPRGSGPLRLGYFGRLIPDKGIGLALEAFGKLPAGTATLDIAGTGEPAYLEALRRTAPPGARFLGWSKPAAFFAAIDIALVPSLWPDPQPRTVFEAFMHGVPVIGAAAGGIPEQIDEGRTGWLFRAGAAEDLARVLTERLRDGAHAALPPDAFRDRLARLEPERVVAAYEAAYAAAIARRPAPSR